MTYMNEFSFPERVPIIITDEIGEILVSFPVSVCDGNIYKSGLVSRESAELIRQNACFPIPRKVIVKNETNGKAILAVGDMFSSTRTLLFLISDADFSVFAALSEGGTFAYTVSASPERDVTPRETEREFEKINNLFVIAGTLFPLSVHETFVSDINKKVRLAAYLCGCKVNITLSHIPRAARENLDASLLCLFLFIQFGIASACSDIRTANLDISVPTAFLTLKVTYEHKEGAKTKNGTRVPLSYFDFSLRFFRSITDRLDLPYAMTGGSTPSAIFSPIRRDFARLGLKTRPVLDDPVSENAEKIKNWLSQVEQSLNEET